MIFSIDRLRKGFTLLELMVVIGMIAIIIGALSTGVTAAQERARVQKATAEVKSISQAILAYENYCVLNNKDLPELSDEDATASTLGFLLGYGESDGSGGKVPTLLMAALRAGDTIRDPWNRPYLVKIKSGNASIKLGAISSNLETGYFFPNIYRLSKEERK